MPKMYRTYCYFT